MSLQTLELGVGILGTVWALAVLTMLWSDRQSQRERADLIEEYERYTDQLQEEGQEAPEVPD